MDPKKTKLDDKIEKHENKPQENKPKPKPISETKNDINRCIYDEICSKNKMCGDCAADEYDREQYEEAYENFKLDQKLDRYQD